MWSWLTNMFTRNRHEPSPATSATVDRAKKQFETWAATKAAVEDAARRASLLEEHRTYRKQGQR